MSDGVRRLGWTMGLAALLAGSAAWADGNIDPVDKYAWSKSAGWVNFSPTNGGATVYGTSGYLAGYVWGENIGWIKLGSGTGPYGNSSSSDWGVNMDAQGKLSGYAWSRNVGWVNFHPTNNNNQVTIAPATGRFDGYAWAENFGWIHFQNASPAYNVKTRPFTRGTVIQMR